MTCYNGYLPVFNCCHYVNLCNMQFLLENLHLNFGVTPDESLLTLPPLDSCASLCSSLCCSVNDHSILGARKRSGFTEFMKGAPDRGFVKMSAQFIVDGMCANATAPLAIASLTL